MMSVVCDGRRELPTGLSREYSSYCGNYSFDGTRLITKVDAASDPDRIGSDQVRGVRFEGDQMILSPPPPSDGSNRGAPRADVGAHCRGVMPSSMGPRRLQPGKDILPLFRFSRAGFMIR